MQHLRENMPWMTHSDTMTCRLVLSLSYVLRRSALLMQVIPGCYCWGQWHPGGWRFGQPVSMQSTVYNGSPHSHWPLSVRAQCSIETPWAWPVKGRQDFRWVDLGVSTSVLWRRCNSLCCALCARANVAASRLIPGGAISARIGRWLVGVALRHPETVCRTELRAA